MMTAAAAAAAVVGNSNRWGKRSTCNMMRRISSGIFLQVEAFLNKGPWLKFVSRNRRGSNGVGILTADFYHTDGGENHRIAFFFFFFFVFWEFLHFSVEELCGNFVVVSAFFVLLRQSQRDLFT